MGCTAISFSRASRIPDHPEVALIVVAVMDDALARRHQRARSLTPIASMSVSAGRLRVGRRSGLARCRGIAPAPMGGRGVEDRWSSPISLPTMPTTAGSARRARQWRVGARRAGRHRIAALRPTGSATRLLISVVLGPARTPRLARLRGVTSAAGTPEIVGVESLDESQRRGAFGDVIDQRCAAPPMNVSTARLTIRRTCLIVRGGGSF